MKKHYRRGGKNWWSEGTRERYKHCYTLQYGGWCRNVKTTNELRQLKGADADGEPVRRRRLNIPTAYDDPRVSRDYGKSWKDYTKRRKQWDR